jgi:hypothetical protein
MNPKPQGLTPLFFRCGLAEETPMNPKPQGLTPLFFPTGPLAPGSDPAERFWLPSETPAQIEPYVVHGTRPTAAESDSYNENLRSAGFNANLTRGELYLGTNAWVADKRDPARWKASVFYQEMLYSMLAAMGPALTKAQRAEYLQAAESAKLQYQNEVWMQGLIEGVARDKDGRIE